MPRIHVASTIRDLLAPEQVAAVLAGKSAPPVYECVTCRQRGDTRRDDTSAILWVGTESEVVLAWAHARCAPSEVRPLEELLAPGAAAAAGPLPEPDTTFCSIADLNNGYTPTITVMPGLDTVAVMPDGDARSAHLTELLGYGFHRLGMGRHQPDGPAGWMVRVRGGRLVSIGSRQTPWWTSRTRPEMPAEWRRYAQARREALVVIVTPGTYDGELPMVDTGDANAALGAAAAEGRVVGGLLPVRGTLSLS